MEAALEIPLQSRLVVLSSMSLGGNVVPVENLAVTLQVVFDFGAKPIHLPMASVHDIPSVRVRCLPSSRRASTPTQWMTCSMRLGSDSNLL